MGDNLQWVRLGRSGVCTAGWGEGAADTCAYTDLLTWLAHPCVHEVDSTAAGDKLLRSHEAPT